jgi:hypothetical protein
MYLRNGRRQVLAQMYYQEAKGPNQKLMSSSQECLGMTRPHKTVEYDLDTVLSKENESSPTIMSETETKPSLTVTSETGNGHRASQLSPQVKQHTIGKEPVKVTAQSPSRLVAVCKPTKSNGNHSKTWQPDPTAGTRRPLEVATIHQTWDGIQIDGETNDTN